MMMSCADLLLQTPSLLVPRIFRTYVPACNFGNSIKFTPPGKSIRIFLENKQVSSGRRKTDAATIEGIVFNITDQGMGIPESELDIVFDKFIQSSKTKSGAGGTGLGLSICKEIIIAS